MILYAFYDLEVAPATYDFIKFLVLAEKGRRRYYCDDLRVVIVPASGRFRKGDLEVYQHYGDYDMGYMEWRLRNILVPCCWLMPSCKGVMVCGDRNEAQRLIECMEGTLYPEGYTVNKPVGKFLDWEIIHEAGEIPSLEATAQARTYVGNWLKERASGRRVVTITLRETAYEPDRNSNLEQWHRFFISLDKGKYLPVMIRDIERAFDLSGFATFAEIPWNIELRQALYELSYLNMFINTGPALLALYDKAVKCLIFKWITPTCASTSEMFVKAQGLEIGGQYKHATPLQRLVWEDDNFDVIQKAFKEWEKHER